MKLDSGSHLVQEVLRSKVCAGKQVPMAQQEQERLPCLETCLSQPAPQQVPPIPAAEAQLEARGAPEGAHRFPSLDQQEQSRASAGLCFPALLPALGGSSKVPMPA